jgi:Flp pilus assembly protein TadD
LKIRSLEADMARSTQRSTLLENRLLRSSALIGALALSGCALGSLPGNYSPIEQQTVADLAGSNYVPRSAEEREAIATQNLFAQTAFWSKEYDLNPADLEAAINLSANLRKMGNPGKSIEIAQHTRALYPRDVDLMTEMAASYVANNDSEKALKIIDAALYQRPQSARLWSLKGAAYDQNEQFAEARKNYGKALQIAPNDPGVLANVGLSYALEGDPRTAEIWLRRAAEMPDASPSVRQNLALVLGLQGKLDEAETWANRDLDSEGAKSNRAYINSLRGRSVTASTPQATIPKTSGPSTQITPSGTVINRQPPPQRKQIIPTQYQQTQPAPKQKVSENQPRAKLVVAGDPSKMVNGPQSVSDAAYYALQQRNAALREDHGAVLPKVTQRPYMPVPPPSTGQVAIAPAPVTTPAPTGSVLEKISRQNMPKSLLAQQRRREHAQRMYQEQQRQQQYYQNQQQQAYGQNQGQVPGQQVPQQVPANGQQQYVPQGYYNQQGYPQTNAQPQNTNPDQREPARDRRR